jgi:hypothetical protein
MKRLGLYVIISAMMMVMVGGFASPEKAYASVTQAEYNTMRDAQFEINVAPFFLPTTTGLINPEISTVTLIERKNALRSKLNTVAQTVFVEKNNLPNADISFMKRSMLLAWDISLESTFDDSYYNIVSERITRADAAVKQAYVTSAVNTNINNGTTDYATGQQTIQQAAATANATIASTLPSKKEGPCTIGKDTNISGCLDQAVSWLIKNTLLKVAGFLVWLAANILNFGVQIGILNFKAWAPDALYAVWVVVRQIVSLFIVFAGLYLGFMYIIGREKAFEKFFPWLIIFALFVNFSYPLTRTFIDVTNIVALNIYSSTVGSEALTWDVSRVLSNDASPGTIIMRNLGLQQLVASATALSTSDGDLVGSINSTAGALATVAFVFYAAYVFFMAAGIIIFRTAVLVFITIASPLLFVDSVIPILGDRAKQLRKLFFEQLVVAPVFMIMLALTMKFIEVFTVGPNAPMRPVVGLIANSSQMVTAFFGVFMMIVMLHIALKVTRSISGSTGEMATNFMGKVGGFGMGVAAGGAGILARGTLGKVAASARDAGWMDKMQGSRMGRGLYSLSNSLANSTYDTRNIGVVGGTMTKAGMGAGFMGVGMGKGSDMTTDKKTEQRGAALNKKYASIKDGDARQAYLDQKDGVGRWQAKIGIKSDEKLAIEKIKKTEKENIDTYNRLTGNRKLEYYNSLPKNLRDKIDAQNAANAAAGSQPAGTTGTGNTSTGTNAGTGAAGTNTNTGTNTGATNNTAGGNPAPGAPGATAGAATSGTTGATTGPNSPSGTGAGPAAPGTNNTNANNTTTGTGGTANTSSGAAPAINAQSPAGPPIEDIETPTVFRKAGGEAEFRARENAPPRNQADAGEFSAPPAENQPQAATGNVQAPPAPQTPGFNASATDLIARRQERRATEAAQAAIRRAQGGSGDADANGVAPISPPPANPSPTGAAATP